ncbi:hypothetical protein [Nocardia salmonicida]|uniref:hypothetical protein n=1 Tax=Nocardia salmonicida TaxID=53431 RepID=UPI0033BFB9B0
MESKYRTNGVAALVDSAAEPGTAVLLQSMRDAFDRGTPVDVGSGEQPAFDEDP